ncbi:winged helix-turn-helix transcriptional regulator [Lacrimispora aerotolerans]|uniref:winged helix-turn-helix transcriptional regulator n=1 Tax=Lacrimispora aerotolerans TaxID=36832 RepID=UPI00055247AF|nr:helix-turn-helix domain-containing protein [Lacrimispora aerotolerans]
MAKKDLYGLCPYVTSQKILSGKWSIYLLYLLQEGPVRFNELQRKMPEDITHTTLSRQLKSLEEEGLIIRREYSQIPPRVEYSLSEIGLKFESVLEALGNWGNDYIEFVEHKDHFMEKDGEAI